MPRFVVVALGCVVGLGCGSDGGGEVDDGGLPDVTGDADGETVADVGDDTTADAGDDAGADVAVDTAADDGGDGADAAARGELTILTYNVAGLPEGLSGSHPEAYIPLISPLLGGYELVVVQEDFWYHELLIADDTHPYRSDPMVDPPTLTDMGDGLNRFSIFPFAAVERTTWADCSGMLDCSSDCLTRKGFSYAVHELAAGIEVHVYNLHMDAGSCPGNLTARSVQGDQLIDAVRTRADGQAVIVAGDTNLQESRPEDVEILARVLADLDLADSCRTLGCGVEEIDRVLFRGSDTVTLTPLSWEHPAEFVDAEGNDLSDHEPVAVRFGWEGI